VTLTDVDVDVEASLLGHGIHHPSSSSSRVYADKRKRRCQLGCLPATAQPARPDYVVLIMHPNDVHCKVMSTA
jgi:hypothetical protein